MRTGFVPALDPQPMDTTGSSGGPRCLAGDDGDPMAKKSRLEEPLLAFRIVKAQKKTKKYQEYNYQWSAESNLYGCSRGQ